MIDASGKENLFPNLSGRTNKRAKVLTDVQPSGSPLADAWSEQG